jgi:excisionase family DNA binding protein
MEVPVEERLVLSVDEAAVRLGLDRKSVYGAVKRNEIPHVRLGNRILIPKLALDRLLAGADQSATAE